jgi:hypothetical protein
VTGQSEQSPRTAIRRKATAALVCIVVPVLLSVLPALTGQDAAGDAMLTGMAAIVLLAVSLPLGFSAWRAAARQTPAVDRGTMLLARAPLLLLGALIGAGIIAGIVSSATP